jgi:hypothetical protein
LITSVDDAVSSGSAAVDAMAPIQSDIDSHLTSIQAIL